VSLLRRWYKKHHCAEGMTEDGLLNVLSILAEALLRPDAEKWSEAVDEDGHS
jgi:hypothetical protein